MCFRSIYAIACVDRKMRCLVHDVARTGTLLSTLCGDEKDYIRMLNWIRILICSIIIKNMLRCPVCNKSLADLHRLNQHLDEAHFKAVEKQETVKSWFKKCIDEAKHLASVAVTQNIVNRSEVFELNESKVNCDETGKEIEVVTKEHWKIGTEDAICSRALCKKPLSAKTDIRDTNTYTQLHICCIMYMLCASSLMPIYPCGKCGNLFCNIHTMYQIKLSKEARHDPLNGIWSRVCKNCYEERDGYMDTNDSRIMGKQPIRHSLSTLQVILPPAWFLTPNSPGILLIIRIENITVDFAEKFHHPAQSRFFPLLPNTDHMHQELSVLRRRIEELVSDFEARLNHLKKNSDSADQASIDAAAHTRKEILAMFSQYDKISRDISQMPAASNTAQELQTAVRLQAGRFLQQNMCSLRSLSCLRHTPGAATTPPQTLCTLPETHSEHTKQKLEILLEQRLLVQNWIRDASRRRKYDEAASLLDNLRMLSLEIKKTRADKNIPSTPPTTNTHRTSE
ncbi:hypothetical protein PMAC_002481 [Pneumocystis sp. 'macacae']|nr:hypothetical protein PMAC_002481 [Pneumocystis sp. 'macacae']